MELSKHKQSTLNNIVSDLQKIRGIAAVVLGGSYAVGAAKENSDIDIGIYYSKVNPFRIGDIKTIANKYSVTGNPIVTDFYEWGPWVNGGAWINTSDGKVDFIYRNLEQVASTIEKAKNGEWEATLSNNRLMGFHPLYI